MGEEIRSKFLSTVGGVMTEEAGAVTGELELLTRPAGEGRLEALVRYAGAEEWYTVLGLARNDGWRGPLRIARHDAGTAYDPGPVESSSVQPVDLQER